MGREPGKDLLDMNMKECVRLNLHGSVKSKYRTPILLWAPQFISHLLSDPPVNGFNHGFSP